VHDAALVAYFAGHANGREDRECADEAIDDALGRVSDARKRFYPGVRAPCCFAGAALEVIEMLRNLRHGCSMSKWSNRCAGQARVIAPSGHSKAAHPDRE
jgi:hypothetical protein